MARWTPWATLSQAVAFTPMAEMRLASSSAGMARGLSGRTVKNWSARGTIRPRMDSTSLSAITPVTKVNFLPGNSRSRLWAVARMPWGLWPPSTMNTGSFCSTSNRAGQRVLASPRRMCSSVTRQPLAWRTFTVSSTTAAFFIWYSPARGMRRSFRSP